LKLFDTYFNNLLGCQIERFGRSQETLRFPKKVQRNIENGLTELACEALHAYPAVLIALCGLRMMRADK